MVRAISRLGTKRRGLNALIDNRDNVVDDRNDKEKARPFDAAQFSRAKDDEFFPGVGHLQRGGDDDRNDHNWDTQIKVACYAQSRAYGKANDGQKYSNGIRFGGSLRSGLPLKRE